jgi:voltage-gated potassium channel Kch
MRNIHLSPDRLREPSLTALLLAQIFVIFVATPMAAAGYGIPWFVIGLVALITLTVIVIVSPDRRAMRTIFAAIVLSWLATVAHEEHRSALTAWLAATTGVLAWLLVCAIVLRVVFGPGRVTIFRIQGAIILYLAVASMFAEFYRLIDFVTLHAFTGMAAGTDAAVAGATTYFSLTTLTSTGYGDIVPLHPLARSLANFEGVIGQLYPATVIARLITLQLESRER